MNEAPPTHRETLQQQAVAWHVRLTSGAADEAVLAEFEQWRRQGPEYEQAYRAVEAVWQKLPSPILADRQRRLALAAKRRRANHARRGLGLAAAASLLLLILRGFYPDYLQHPLADYRTRIGEQTSITLADGSIAHLNTDTAIDVTISGSERRIALLRGEAEFDVAHDAGRPFRVTSGTTTTEALGTRFVVRYDGQAGSVTLLQGRIRSSRPSAQGAQTDSATLSPGQQITFDAEKLGSLRSVELNNADAWRRGRLLMNFVPLKQVIAEINRYRRSQIRLLDDNLAEREVNIAVDIQQIDAWLQALQQTLPIKVVEAGPFVFLRS
ncbi:iron dicitrate transport regulator FecR [Methylomonas methanica]|uniref:Iron dicitrate transport regulator FecR n=2 Tax=Methylomonas TaxID=416 RepID=A0A126T3T1_9GAMM|nr:iron dicitrate transport regulator FecR [Methylomonas denitrificans]OAI00079.1 iron dicitrate transport regulator FecR [Methylomonas methanica]